MYGRPPRFGYGSGRGREAGPPPAPPPLAQPTTGANFNYNGFFQNLNMFCNGTSFNPGNVPFQSQNYQPQTPITYFQGFQQPQFMRPNVKEALEKIDREVVKARRDILVSGDNVSAWKVSQAVCLALKVDSWESLGFRMQQVPSLYDLIVTEGKINAFIHCFVGVRRITTLHDLELAICENEGIEKFVELDLGPLVKHPLVAHYFSVSSDIKDIFRITSEEIISCLHEFMTVHPSKEVKIDELLDFIAENRSVAGREKLNVRIQNLGRHIAVIRKATQSENITMMKHADALKEKFGIKVRRRPILSSQKQKLDDRYNNITERVQTFSGSSTKFCGKHIRFKSSSDEDDSSSTDNESNNYQNGSTNHPHLIPQNLQSSDKVSSCPYPSVAEELERLGLKPEVDSNVGKSCCNKSFSVGEEPLKRKRKASNTCGSSLPQKLIKRDENKRNLYKGNMKTESCTEETNDSEILSESMLKFVAIWKETCCRDSGDQVLDKMLSFYRIKKKKKLQALLSSDPFVGLLDIALNSIKSGFFDSMHHTFKTFSLPGTVNGFAKTSTNYLSTEVESGQRDDRTSAKIKCGISIDDIIKKLSSYFEPDSDVASHANSTSEKKLLFLRKLCKLESWLIEQFSIKDFESFGYGDILTFIKGHLHLLPHVLQKLIIGENSEAIPFEVCMLELQLDLLFSQASAGAWENGMISKQKILALLRRQFPSFCFKSTEGNLLVDYRDLIREKEINIAPKCVLFSATMLKEPCLEDSTVPNENLLLESAGSDCKEVTLGSVTTKDAIDVLLTAPMLADLASWSHWDIIYAPSLGPLVLWLLNEVNTKELLCLVTRSGKIIRLDQSATLDSFLEVLLKGSSSGTALQLLSLLALYGGERNVPLHLLKCHVNRAFHVLLENSFEKDLSNANPHVCNELPKQLVPEGKRMLGNLSHDLNHDGNMVYKKVASASRFILDCLCYVPTEFCGFAASVLLSGFQSSFRDAPKAILSECNQVEERVMLHDVGFSLGIVEWINDYHAFCSTVFSNSLLSLESPDSKLKSNDDFGGARFSHEKDSMCHSSTHDSLSTIKANCNDILNVNHKVEKRSEVSVQASDHDSSSVLNLLNASSVIESIRRDEFGLDPGLSPTECKMLEKQHARLGRALHCLSHELYSQDSHFLLELVQNADDNIYPQNVEPSLVFVLQKKGIVVMNNEIGFSAENIRALCDVGNSTKKGQSAGYIGKKGIGFKSVFRVTDAPEIHSNGFHIKFDISKGQIGFVLPTLVSPCDTDFYSGLVMSYTGHANCNSWKTCIVLPFKKTLSDSFIKGNVISMFSDLHPSLLLFLHRLKCIIFRNMLTDSIIVMKKEVLMDGITRVSLGKERIHWLVVAQKLQSIIRPDVQSTEISVAFTLEETDDGGYTPQLTEQPVFAFLPLRTYGLKFILQGDFVLPSSREEVDGSSAWNQWLLSEFPGLFVGAERAFCDLPCFQRSLGKAVTAFMRFVPLLGEVQGFFSLLPRMIISKLRTANCMLLDGDNNHWVPPCKVLRNWTEEARVLLPDRLLHEHLGLGFLNRDIVLSDSLAKALGIEDYGPKTLLQIISSLSNSESGLKLVSLSWLSSLINAIYLTSLNSGTESELISKLRKVPFVPLSDGKYSSMDRGTIWLHSGVTGLEIENNLEAFPKLYAKLRTVSPELFSAAAAADKSCLDKSILENVTRMLLKVGVQKLSGHDIVKMHILSAISDTRNTSGNTELMTEYLCFIMFHMQSGCRDCSVEREWIMDHLRSKALILTNYGYKQLNEVPIHFSKEYGNLIPLRKLLDGIEFKWHEVDSTYLRHPITKSLCDGVSSWRSFFMELSVTDFVQIVRSEKCIGDLSHAVLKDMMQDGDLMSTGSVVKDWESAELVQLLSHLSSRGEHEKCKHLLEILDTFWDSYFSEKNIGYCNLLPFGERKPFKSSLVSILQNVRWMVSMADKDFHYAKDLFHDCEAVRSILGGGAPYVVPKVKNQKLIVDLGLKSEVRLDDILMVITSWRTSKNPIRASISQMIRLYTFIWNGMTSSKQKTIVQLSSGPFIFVPLVPAVSPDDVVTGSLLSPKEVYWHDATGSMDQMKLMHPKCATDMAHLSFSKILCNFYPTLHDFFVNDCGVEEIPPSNSYVQILLHLSTISLPSEAATTVFHVFSKWADCLTSGLLKDEDVECLRETFMKKECAVLPTELDKWVSLHPSFGLICWSDDEHLRKEFKHHDSIDLLYFGNLSDDEKKVLKTKVATLFRRLRIPALSEVVSREAIYYGPTDSSLKASLVNWALPYTQRYIRHMYPDKYLQHGRSKFEKLRNLQIVVVERLFYRNVVKKCEIASKKRIECSCLLQGNTLYATRDSDSHSIFMELSHLLFGEAPDLHLANFLHLITTMVAAGSTEEQIELFILTSQKIPKLPVEEEPIWSMSIISEKNDSTIKADFVSTSIDEPNVLKSKRLRLSNNTNWPPVDWKTAPGFKYAQANGFKTQASCSPQSREATEKLEMEIQTDNKPQPEMNNTWTFQNGPTSTSEDICLSDVETFEAHAAGNVATSFLDSVLPPKSVDAAVGLECATSASAVSNHLSLCTSSAQTMITGRLGEFVAFKYFEGKFGLTSVRWVNEANETGLPYDLLIDNEESSCEFIEVKTTKSGKKNWFEISTREWQFAAEKGVSFSIAHVVLLENNTARVRIYKNPVKLCQQGELRLAILIP